LKTDQVGAQRGRGRAGKRRLADACLALEEERPLQPEREKQRYGKTTVRQVVLVGEPVSEVGDGSRENGDDL